MNRCGFSSSAPHVAAFKTDRVENERSSKPRVGDWPLWLTWLVFQFTLVSVVAGLAAGLVMPFAVGYALWKLIGR